MFSKVIIRYSLLLPVYNMPIVDIDGQLNGSYILCVSKELGYFLFAFPSRDNMHGEIID